MDIDGDILATFTEWTANIRFFYYPASYPEYINGLREFHLIIEDFSIPFGTYGRGKDFYYIPKTGKTGMTPQMAAGPHGEEGDDLY